MADAMRKKPCGSCTVCCVAPSIPSHEGEVFGKGKPACTECAALKGGNCSVYEKRPDLCRGYFCLYALGDVPERPDKAGWVAWSYQLTPDQRGMILVGHCLDVLRAIFHPWTKKVVRMALSFSYGPLCFEAVTIRDAKQIVSFERSGWTICGQIDPADPLKQEVDESTIQLLLEGDHDLTRHLLRGLPFTDYRMEKVFDREEEEE